MNGKVNFKGNDVVDMLPYSLRCHLFSYVAAYQYILFVLCALITGKYEISTLFTNLFVLSGRHGYD